MYLKVAATIKNRIHSCAYQRGEWIPAAKYLAEEFGVSTITIRKAVERLVQEGYLTARQGAGTRVTFPEQKKMEIQISGNFREWFDSASGRSPRLEIEMVDLVPFQAPQSIRTLLDAARDEPVGRLRRLRRHHGQVVSYYINYFRAEHLHRLPRGKLTQRSFIEVFQESTRIRLKRLEQRVESIIAEMDLAKVLDTDYGSPLFFIENNYYAHREKPVLVTHMYYRGDCYVYKAAIPLDADPLPPQRSSAVMKKTATGPETCYANDPE
jgi:DNA-binding GntR family transcriptional regulator